MCLALKKINNIDNGNICDNVDNYSYRCYTFIEICFLAEQKIWKDVGEKEYAESESYVRVYIV